MRAVSDLAGEFAEKFCNRDRASLAGLWRDPEKFGAEFQNKIRRETGFDEEAHIENAHGKVSHSSAGALCVVEKLGEKGRVLACCIAGRHAGGGLASSKRTAGNGSP